MFIEKVISNVNETNIFWCLICFITISAVFVKILFLHIGGKRKRILANKIPGPAGAFLVGSLSLVIEGSEKGIENVRNIYRTYEKSLFKFWILNELYIVITKPEDVQFVLNNPKLQKKAKMYSMFQKSCWSEGIFSTDNIEKWKINRKNMSAGINFKILKSFVPIFYEEAKVLSESIREHCATTHECDIIHPVCIATMEIIGKTTLGVSFNAQEDGQHRFVENVEKIMGTYEYRVVNPWFLSDALYGFSSVKRKHDRYQKNIIEFIYEIINEKLSKLSRNNNVGHENGREKDDDEYTTDRKSKSIVEILFGYYPEMSLKQIREEIITIVIAGQDTTAITLARIIFMLAHHQEIQNNVFEETQSIFAVGDPTRCPTYEDLHQMKYLERVIKETLRVSATAPMIGRKLEEEMRIGEYLCPADSTLVLFPLFMNTSPLYYTDPDTFNPDNFLPEACESRHPYTYLAFSAGPRNCFGIKYAMLQMKTIISTLIRTNKFLPSDRCPTLKSLRNKFSFTLKFVEGCHVKIEPRTP